MNKTLWRLQTYGERLWLLANMMAQSAAGLGSDGRGVAVVAEETRQMANRIQNRVERSLFGEDEIKPDNMRDNAFELNLLALNCAIECEKIGSRSKHVAVCVEDVRILAYEMSMLFSENGEKEPNFTDMKNSMLSPFPKSPIKSVESRNAFLLFYTGGLLVSEPAANIEEVCTDAERTDTHIKLRGMEIPLVDGDKLLGKPQDISTYVILRTPWAEQNKVYAVAAELRGLSYSPIGTPANVPADTPLAGYVREYWEGENDTPFIFMDWVKMIS